MLLGHGSKVKTNFGTLCIKPCGRDESTVLAQLLSNFTHKMLITGGGTLSILGHGIKSQGLLLNFVYKTLRHDADKGFRRHLQTSYVSL